MNVKIYRKCLNLISAQPTEVKRNWKQRGKPTVQLLISSSFVPLCLIHVQFPWSLIGAEQAKICSKINDSLIPLDFASKFLKHWSQHFDVLFNCKFITERLARIAIMYNSCSLPLQQQILSMDVGSQADKEEFTFQELLQILSVLCNCPNHQEQALQQLYSGINQASGDSVPVYLETVRSVAEDAYELASRWTENQVSLVLQKVVSGLRNKDLAQLTSSYVIALPFNFNSFRDCVIQYEMRIPSHPPAVHAITSLRCFKCNGQHLVRDCTVVCCMKCAGQHKTNLCKVPQEKPNCNKCSLSNHTTSAHIEFPRKSAPRAGGVEEVGVFTCFSAGTSFVDGAVSINNGGKDSFVNSKLLVHTGALLPSRIAISKAFFSQRMWGNARSIKPSNLPNASGALANSTMRTVGQVDVRIKMSNINFFFEGQALILENLFLPVILGVNFLKSNSLSPILEQDTAQLVHTP